VPRVTSEQKPGSVSLPDRRSSDENLECQRRDRERITGKEKHAGCESARDFAAISPRQREYQNYVTCCRIDTRFDTLNTALPRFYASRLDERTTRIQHATTHARTIEISERIVVLSLHPSLNVSPRGWNRVRHCDL